MGQLPSVHDFAGRHSYADIFRVPDTFLHDNSVMKAALEAGIRASGATICGSVEKAFDPHGYTCLYLLAESHVSIHTYPQEGALFFDAFTCGPLDPNLILQAFVAALGSVDVRAQLVERGLLAFRSATPDLRDKAHA